MARSRTSAGTSEPARLRIRSCRCSSAWRPSSRASPRTASIEAAEADAERLFGGPLLVRLFLGSRRVVVVVVVVVVRRRRRRRRPGRPRRRGCDRPRKACPRRSAPLRRWPRPAVAGFPRARFAGFRSRRYLLRAKVGCVVHWQTRAPRGRGARRPLHGAPWPRRSALWLARRGPGTCGTGPATCGRRRPSYAPRPPWRGPWRPCPWPLCSARRCRPFPPWRWPWPPRRWSPRPRRTCPSRRGWD